MVDRKHRFPTSINGSYVHFSGETHVWTFTLAHFAEHSEPITMTADDVKRIRGDIGAMIRTWRSPGELRRVESQLIDYDPVPPYRISCSPLINFRDYDVAQDLARTHSGARHVAVSLRDAADVVTWEIRLTNEPLGE